MILNNENTVESSQFDGINYKLLNEARIAKKVTFERLATDTKVPEPTVKNILTGKTKHPRPYSLDPLCEYLDVSKELVYGGAEQKAIIEKQGIKEDDKSILALKEIYEIQSAAMKETNELHINNIRSHYEQHRDDMKANYEMRLNDKREIIRLKDESIEKLEKSVSKRTLVIIILSIITALFFASFIGLLVLELMHPEHGWITH